MRSAFKSDLKATLWACPGRTHCATAGAGWADERRSPPIAGPLRDPFELLSKESNSLSFLGTCLLSPLACAERCSVLALAIFTFHRARM